MISSTRARSARIVTIISLDALAMKVTPSLQPTTISIACVERL
jgi:hypothetical protein